MWLYCCLFSGKNLAWIKMIRQCLRKGACHLRVACVIVNDWKKTTWYCRKTTSCLLFTRAKRNRSSATKKSDQRIHVQKADHSTEHNQYHRIFSSTDSWTFLPTLMNQKTSWKIVHQLRSQGSHLPIPGEWRLGENFGNQVDSLQCSPLSHVSVAWPYLRGRQ